jgi:hypothetical protein
MTRLLYFQRNSLSYPFDKRLGGHHSQSWHCGVEKKPWPCQESSEVTFNKVMWKSFGCVCVCENEHTVVYVVEIVDSCSVVLLVGVSRQGNINMYERKWSFHLLQFTWIIRKYGLTYHRLYLPCRWYVHQIHVLPDKHTSMSANSWYTGQLQE